MRSARFIVVGLSLLTFTACGQAKMMQTMGRVRNEMLAQRYDAALGVLRQGKKKGAFKEQDRVMFWMEEGMLLYLTRQYKAATGVLQKAEQRTKELFTKSISKNIKAAFTSEAATDYQGEDYEKVLLNVVKAFAYLGMRDFSGAMVEARKINSKLELFNTKYKGKLSYNQDAFAHWLIGLLNEMEGSYDNARISYLKAWQTYKNDFAPNYRMRVPSYVAEDVARAAILSGARDLLQKYRGEMPPTAGQTAELMKTKGEIVLFHLNGEGPSKTDYFVRCVIRSAANWHCDGEPGGEFMRKTRITIAPGADVIKVAFPKLILRHPPPGKVFMAAGNARSLTQVAYPLSRIAAKVLRDKTGRIFKNAIIRVVTKYLTSKAAGAVGKKLGGGVFGALAKIGSSAAFQAMEEADKRAWTTLPSRIDIGRMWVSPGVHTVILVMPDGRELQLPGVKVRAGKRVFISFRTM